jgi:hypothetical protein
MAAMTGRTNAVAKVGAGNSAKGNRNMQEQDEQLKSEQDANNRSGPAQLWKVLLGLIGVALLLNVALASTALNYLVPTAAGDRQQIGARLNWYVNSGQLQADARSLAAAFDYIMATDRDAPATTTNLAVLPVVEDTASDTPKS